MTMPRDHMPGLDFSAAVKGEPPPAFHPAMLPLIRILARQAVAEYLAEQRQAAISTAAEGTSKEPLEAWSTPHVD